MKIPWSGTKCTEQTLYEHLMLEVNDILNAANATLVDDSKSVHELLFGFTDPIFEQIAARLEGH